MLNNLKRILLTQYIGAIITAYIAVQAILGLIALATYILATLFQPRTSNVFGGMSPRPDLEWNRILPELIRATLQLLVAAGFVRWLFVEHTLPPVALESDNVQQDDLASAES